MNAMLSKPTSLRVLARCVLRLFESREARDARFEQQAYERILRVYGADPKHISAQFPAVIECRSVAGIGTGLIDGIIAQARVIRAMNIAEIPEVREALKDLRDDPDIAWLVSPQNP